LSRGFWAGSSSRFKRFITILLCLVFCIVVTTAGIFTPLSSQDTKSLNDEVRQLRASNENMSLWQGAFSLFENNFIIDLIMFIPIYGWIFGSFALYNSGKAFNAQSTSAADNPSHWPAILIFLTNFISPHQSLEFIAYATALAASIWLFSHMLRGGGKRELKRTGMFILICAGLLLLAAFIEQYLILVFKP